MKNTILITGALLLSLTACKNEHQNHNKHQPETTTTEPASPTIAAPEAVYACPMHPEVTGVKGDKCPKCKMNLEEKK